MTTSPAPFLTTKFSLREIVSEVCDTHPEANPVRLVEPVLALINPADYEEALRQALHGFITTHVVSDRSTTHAQPSGQPRKIGRSRLSGLSKLLANREYSPVRGEWILFAEANAEDLKSMAAKREAMAEHYVRLAEWYDSAARALNANGATTIADLPFVVQEELLTSRP